jgi:hypothetical protein
MHVRPNRSESFRERVTEAGAGKTCMGVAALVDTNVLVYPFDPRLPFPYLHPSRS